MSFPIFGELVEEEVSEKGAPPQDTPQFEEFGELVEEKAPQIPGYRSVIKGAAKALPSYQPLGRMGPISPRASEKILESLLPTPDTPGHQYAEKISENAAEWAKFGPLGPALGAASGALEEFAKQKDAPEWVQKAVSLLPALKSPMKEGGKLLPSKGQKEAVAFLRKKGFTDKEITPLIQSSKKLSPLSKVMRKGHGVEERLSEINNRFQKSYDTFRKEGKDLPLPKNRLREFEDKFEDVWEDIPVDQRKILRELKEDFMGKPITRESLQDFFHGINRNIYGKGAVGSKEILAKLKDPIYEGMEMIAPESAKDFKLLNELNSKKFEVFKKMSPKEYERLITIGELGGLMTAIGAQNFKAVGAVIGEIGTRQLATEMLMNPKLQNISNKMARALGNNRGKLFEDLSQQFMKSLKKSNSSLYKEIKQKQNERKKSPPEQEQ